MDNRDRRNTSGVYTEEQIKRVLVGSGITIEGEVDSDYLIFCPFHSNFRTPAGEIDKTTGKFFCFSCHHITDLIEFIMHVSGRTYFESVRYIRSKEVASSIEDDVNRGLIVKPMFKEYDMDIIDRLHDTALVASRAQDYYHGRHINNDSIRKFKLGYSGKQDMVTIPMHTQDGMCVGFVARSVEGKDFKNTPGLPKSKILFNLHRVKTSKTVYVVESSFDAIRLDQCGIPAVATLGASVSSMQAELLQKYFNDIIVIADNDEAGGNMKDKLIKKLGSRVTTLQLNNEYKDVGDMDDESINNLRIGFDKSIELMLS